jgi:NTP pyrophosphatase (non-canonical NTP hydrolase)
LPSPSEEVLGSSQGHGTASSGEGKPRDAGESPAPVLIRTSAPDESCATCFGVHGNPPCPGTSAAPVPDESRQSRICKPWCGHDGHHQLYQEADETLLCGNAFAEPGWEDAKTGEPANRRWCSAVCRDQRFPPKKPEYEPKTVEQRLGYLIEECGEVLQAAGKSIRWGLQSVNPELPASQQESNQEWLRRELKDLKAAIRRIEDVL